MTVRGFDPFDLPDWIATSDVVWRPREALGRAHLLRGDLVGVATHPCDVFGVDQAYPQPVALDELRVDAHREWHHGQVLCLEMDGRFTLAVPGSAPDVHRVLVALARLSLAVGAAADHLSAQLSLGDTERGHRAR